MIQMGAVEVFGLILLFAVTVFAAIHMGFKMGRLTTVSVEEERVQKRIEDAKSDPDNNFSGATNNPYASLRTGAEDDEEGTDTNL